jgi:prolyl 4-hydroxylase
MAGAASQPYHEGPTPFAEQCSELRAAIGSEVGRRLDSSSRLRRLGLRNGNFAQLYAGDDFLNPETCRLLCAKIDEGSFPSPLFEKDKHEGVRTSSSCNFDLSDPIVAAVDTRISALLGLAGAQGEPLQGQRYEQGQQFREHADFFYVDEPYWAEYEPHGGQRTWTAMIYLNEPAAGGATRFRLLGLEIQPKPGRILVWNNMAADGSPNPWTVHEGTAIAAGSKYIVTKWYRERRFA